MWMAEIDFHPDLPRQDFMLSHLFPLVKGGALHQVWLQHLKPNFAINKAAIS